jgi:hypothetical protein
MRELGRCGRWGNQVFQYQFLRLYADRWGLEVQLPPWVGNELCGFSEPNISVMLPHAHEKWQGNHLDEQVPPRANEFVNTDWRGYAQYHASYYAPWKYEIRSWFMPTLEVLDQVLPATQWALEQFIAKRTIIGLHIRRGDYGRLIFHLTPKEWWRKWLEENWQRFVNPILFIATESPETLEWFADYDPVTMADLNVTLKPSRRYYNYLSHDLAKREPWQMDFFPDWYMLTLCDVLALSNSTFGFTAAMMNKFLQECWRSSIPEQGFESIDPWDSRPMRLERCEDYPDVEGIALKRNPYW